MFLPGEGSSLVIPFALPGEGGGLTGAVCTFAGDTLVSKSCFFPGDAANFLAVCRVATLVVERSDPSSYFIFLDILSRDKKMVELFPRYTRNRHGQLKWNPRRKIRTSRGKEILTGATIKFRYVIFKYIPSSDVTDLTSSSGTPGSLTSLIFISKLLQLPREYLKIFFFLYFHFLLKEISNWLLGLILFTSFFISITKLFYAK